MKFGDLPNRTKRYWVPDEGTIITFSEEIRMIRDCPYIRRALLPEQPRYTLVSLLVDTSEFFPDEVVEDLENSLGFLFDDELNYQLQVSMSAIHLAAVDRILGIVGHDKNVPVFEKWISSDTAVFLSREGHYSDINPHKGSTLKRARQLGNYRVPARVQVERRRVSP